MLLNPMATVDHLSGSGRYESLILIVVGVAASMAVLINVPAMRRGVAEVVFADVKRRTDSAAIGSSVERL